MALALKLVVHKYYVITLTAQSRTPPGGYWLGNQFTPVKRSSFMRANPLECRTEALRCSELSETAATELGRQIYSDLAKAWSWLAEGFEGLRARPRAAFPRKKAA